MRVVFFGTPAFAVPSLQRLARDFQVVLVVSRPDRPVGRARRLTAPPAAAAARALDLDLFQPPNPNRAAAVEAIASYEPDAVVVAAYGRLIRAPLRRLAPRGVVNAHPSLLPAYRGASPIQAAIAAGETAAGVTLIRLDDDLDAGPIVAARRLAIGPTERAPSLHDRLAAASADLLADVLPRWAAGEAAERPQRADRATLTRPLERADAELDLRRPARELFDRWRAFQPWPGAFVRVGETTCTLVELAALPDPSSSGAVCPPDDAPLPGCGEVHVRDRALLLGCGAGALRVERLQPAGRRAMTAQDFERGYQRLLAIPWGVPHPEPRPPLARPLPRP